MVTPDPQRPDIDIVPSSLSIKSFYISGGIFGTGHNIAFPTPPSSGAEAGILILSGKNGTGKTTILRMISEIIGEELNFDTFRRVPFSHARLEFSDGQFLTVERVQDTEYPLVVTYGDLSAQLFKRRHDAKYSEEQRKKITEIRSQALPLVRRINIELLDIHRSLALKRGGDVEQMRQIQLHGLYEHTVFVEGSRAASSREQTLSNRVRNFMRDAQIDYRRFFAADELELLPRIVGRFHNPNRNLPTREMLLSRVAAVRDGFQGAERFGLQTDDADLNTLDELLQDKDRMSHPNSLTLVEAYVEMQENRQKARELVVTRLLEFEKIMDEFLQNKSVRIDTKKGLEIYANGETLPETDLSSGEYHFLYMMVAALLCRRSGTIIAIDEPELSLHVTWQRKVIAALARCAARASPVFLFATHAPAIAAEYPDREYSLSPLE